MRKTLFLPIGLLYCAVGFSFNYPYVCPTPDQLVFDDSPAPGETNVHATSKYVIDKKHCIYEQWHGGAFGVTDADNCSDADFSNSETPTCTYYQNGQPVIGLQFAS